MNNIIQKLYKRKTAIDKMYPELKEAILLKEQDEEDLVNYKDNELNLKKALSELKKRYHIQKNIDELRYRLRLRKIFGYLIFPGIIALIVGIYIVALPEYGLLEGAATAFAAFVLGAFANDIIKGKEYKKEKKRLKDAMQKIVVGEDIYALAKKLKEARNQVATTEKRLAATEDEIIALESALNSMVAEINLLLELYQFDLEGVKEKIVTINTSYGTELRSNFEMEVVSTRKRIKEEEHGS